MKQRLIEVTRDEWSDNSVRLILTPGSHAKRNLFYIQEIGFFEATKNYYVKRKNLSSFLILQTLSGQGMLYYEGKAYSLSRGDVFFIDCEKEHSYHIQGTEPWVFNWIHFNGLSTSEYCADYARYNGRPLMTMEVNELNGIFEDLLSINASPKNTNEILSSLKITEMITLLTLYGQSLHADVAPGNDPAEEVVRYIEKHLNEKITLEGIARHFNMNKYSFHKLFKQYTNVPLGEFIIMHRITRAKALLRFSSMSVQDVGDAVGISHTSHFINLFRDREGITPLQYKRQWNEPEDSPPDNRDPA